MHPYSTGGPPPPAIPEGNRWRDRPARPGPVIVETPPLASSVYSPHPLPHAPPPPYPQYQPPPIFHNAPFSPPPEMMAPMQHFIPMAPMAYPQPPPPIAPIHIIPTPPPAPPKLQPPPPPPPQPVSYGGFEAAEEQPSSSSQPSSESIPRSLPWYSAPDEPFPARKRRPKPKPKPKPVKKTPQPQAPVVVNQPVIVDTPPPSTQAPSEVDSTVPTTPISAPSTTAPSTASTTAPKKITPAVPVIKPTHTRTQSTKTVTKTDLVSAPATPVTPKPEEPKETVPAAEEPEKLAEPQEQAAPPPPPPVQPKSWAELVKKTRTTNGTGVKPVAVKVNGVGKNVSLAEALAAFELAAESIKAPLLQPRGLINTGNMCFMNAVLQMLVFCGPFYSFLQRLGNQVTHNFRGDTPLFDAMILFMREFRVIPPPSGKTPEEFGEAFVPEFVYDVIRRLERFSTMRRGHQQDAEEFLGFLLDGLHEELIGVMKQSEGAAAAVKAAEESTEDASGWLEVGVKGKAATTRSTDMPESPITKIFGGQLRSELRVPGAKPSVTFEPYQPLQLDIQSNQIHSIVDALKHLTTPESIHGEFKTRGQNLVARKQVFVETFPPVLILHLKRFQYDNTGGTQKIWKKVGYPLVLEIPAELVHQVKRSQPRPKYRLIGVIYHHGKFASGGHYTVDVLRQDGKSWIRLDDTKITRISAQDVAVSVDAAEAAKQNEESEVEEDTIDGPWEHANGTANGSSKASQRAAANQAMAAHANATKDGKVAYILFYQKL